MKKIGYLLIALFAFGCAEPDVEEENVAEKEEKLFSLEDAWCWLNGGTCHGGGYSGGGSHNGTPLPGWVYTPPSNPYNNWHPAPAPGNTPNHPPPP